MRQVYKCDFCEDLFENETQAKEHEEHCGRNPKNKIESVVLFRLAMIYESFSRITACALHEVAASELEYLWKETHRASDTNCFYAIKRHQHRMLNNLDDAVRVKNKHQGRNSSTYKDVLKEYPEIYEAIVKTLQRKAWNE